MVEGCIQCGMPVSRTPGARGKSPTFCSKRCGELHRRSSNLTRPIPDLKVCSKCGHALPGTAFGRRRDGGLNSACTGCRRGRPGLASCQWCGVSFQPKHYHEQTCCSRECGFAWLNVQRWIGKTCPLRIRTCPFCNCEFYSRGRSPFCSDICHKAKMKQDRTLGGVAPILSMVCGHCGKSVIYQRLGAPRAYCSLHCARAANGRNRDARKRGAFVAPVRRADIWKRDGGRCQLCRRKIKPNLKAPHHQSLTLDHIVPLAKGGTHEPSNVQLAHFICNVRKNDRLIGQLRLFG